MELISAENLDLTEYSDSLVYQVIERVTVLSKDAGSLGAAGVSLCLLFSLRNGGFCAKIKKEHIG